MPGKSAKRLYGSIAVMRLQEDANGDPINVIPAYILVPAALEGAANRAVLSSSSLFPVDQNGMLNQNPGIINVVKDMAQVVVEPRLDRIWNSRRASLWTVLHGRCVSMLAWRRWIIGAW